MTDVEILSILKMDLQIASAALDSYLAALVASARGFITREGINLTDSAEDGMLIEMYAAYLYRKRREENTMMPRALRWALNNRGIGGGKNG